MKDLAKRFETKDGNTRISIYNEEYAENPRYMTDEPLHCEDWSRDYSIMLKNEFLKYSGCDEEYWNGKSLDEIEWLLDELKAWGDNDVYGYVVENCIKSKIHKEYINVDKEDEDYEEEEWEEADSCLGFYGELNTILSNILLEAGYKAEDLKEV